GARGWRGVCNSVQASLKAPARGAYSTDNAGDAPPRVVSGADGRDRAVDEAVRLCPGEGVTEYFRELVDDVAGQQRLGLDPMTSYYVVQLLATFARTDAVACDAFWTDQPMGALLGEAIAAGGSEQRKRLRKVGDASPALPGLFPNPLPRSLVDVDYYMRIGGIPYDSLSHDGADLFSTAFAELASR